MKCEICQAEIDVGIGWERESPVDHYWVEHCPGCEVCRCGFAYNRPRSFGHAKELWIEHLKSGTCTIPEFQQLAHDFLQGVTHELE